MFITPFDAHKSVPLTEGHKIYEFRQEIIRLLSGADNRLLLLVGPCSIHSIDATLEYAQNLAHLAESVKDTFFIVMRTYLEKPRTQHGWKGFMNDPFLNGTHEIEQAILLARKLLSDLTKLKLPLATEFLDPYIAPYIQDFISWGSIGARTSESPIHRQLAAELPMAIGFKNRTDGNMDVAIQGCLVAKEKHHFLGIDHSGKVTCKHAPGNPFPHLVLRGGHSGPNYDAMSLHIAKEKLLRARLPLSLIVDCSHGNSKKDHRQQLAVFTHLLEHPHPCVRGLMLESFLREANQSYPLAPDISITDPCLDWASTKELIEMAATVVAK